MRTGAAEVFGSKLFQPLVWRLIIILGHDVSIEAFLAFINKKMDDHVPYASRLVVEKWSTDRNTSEFRIDFHRPCGNVWENTVSCY